MITVAVERTKAAELFQMCRHNMLTVGKHLCRGCWGRGGEREGGAERLLQDYIESPGCYHPVLGTGACEHQLGLCPTHIPGTDTNMGSDGIRSLFFFSFFYDETGLGLRQHYELKSRACTTY